MTGVILAGGKNSRMGTKKAFVTVHGERIIDRMLRIYRALFDEIIIVTNTPRDYVEFDAIIATDIIEEKAALGGIFTGLFHASSKHVFFSACDMPFISRDFIAYMMEKTAVYDIIVPNPPDGLQPLHAIYSRKYMPAIEELLKKDMLKITGFYGRKRIHRIPPETVSRFDPNDTLFMNINTVEDLSRAKNIDKM